MRYRFIFLSCLFSFAGEAVTFTESFRAAIGKNEAVKQAQFRINQVQEQANTLRGGVFPQLSVTAMHSIQPEPADPTARQFSPAHQTTVSAGVKQQIFQGLREFTVLRQKRFLKAAEVAGEHGVYSTLYQEVAASYLNVLTHEQDLKNLGEQSDLYTARVGELRARMRRGESAESEVVSAQATQASLMAEIRLVEGQRDEARESFHFLTGLDKKIALEDPAFLSKGKKSLLPLETYLHRIEERPDVKVALEQFHAAEEGVSLARGAHWPSVEAYGNYYFMRPGFLADLKWDVGVRLTLPIFEGGSTQARVREAISVRGAQELELQRLRRNATREIRSLYERVGARLAHMEGLKTSVDLSNKNVSLLQRDYRRGLARNIDIQLALSELRNAKRGFDKARFAGQIEFCQLQAAAASIPGEMKGTSSDTF